VETLTFTDRIKKARREAGLSQTALAEAMSQIFDKKKISRSAIAQWESSKTHGIEAANLLKATKILGVTPDWLQFGYGEMREKKSRFSSSTSVPLLSYAQAMNGMEKEEKENLSKIGLDEELAKIASPHSFALVIHDTSMAPIFMPDDIIIIDPTVVPSPGEFVVAKLKENKDKKELLIFRKYRPLFYNGSDGFELIALSEDWNKIVVHDRNEGEILGTLIEHRCKRRIHEQA
jgi:SOS-response transcriptional repressor LexA